MKRCARRSSGRSSSTVTTASGMPKDTSGATGTSGLTKAGCPRWSKPVSRTKDAFARCPPEVISVTSAGLEPSPQPHEKRITAARRNTCRRIAIPVDYRLTFLYRRHVERRASASSRARHPPCSKEGNALRRSKAHDESSLIWGEYDCEHAGHAATRFGGYGALQRNTRSSGDLDLPERHRSDSCRRPCPDRRRSRTGRQRLRLRQLRWHPGQNPPGIRELRQRCDQRPGSSRHSAHTVRRDRQTLLLLLDLRRPANQRQGPVPQTNCGRQGPLPHQTQHPLHGAHAGRLPRLHHLH